MKIGLSTYSLAGAILDGRLDLPGTVRTIAEWGGEHSEVVPVGVDFLEHPEVAQAVKSEAEKAGIPLSSYTFGANFITGKEGDLTLQQRNAEIERVKKHVDIAARLGVKIVRHDVGSRPVEKTSVAQFERDLPIAAEACAAVADYAKQYGITTSLENHGRHFQGSERVRRLVEMVNRDNFKCVVDVGNFCGVDEDPVSAVMNNCDIAVMFHFKDNYLRKFVIDPENWSRSKHGNFIKGAITGYGDIDLRQIVAVIKASGFNGFISIEYEGHEECLFGAKRSLDCVKRLFAS